MEQQFIKDPDRKIGDLITDAVSTLGENIIINHFPFFCWESKEEISLSKILCLAKVRANLIKTEWRSSSGTRNFGVDPKMLLTS
ncbi:MAG: hypothetical protein Ct9H300mP18_13110 [Candidatus Neomarinimicrobiota bacterium]|nr:MAG: hypothetical protein Ct9H300mP18_13110 [Candidatus Neomarinimicrobiota bacterium]